MIGCHERHRLLLQKNFRRGALGQGWAHSMFPTSISTPSRLPSSFSHFIFSHSPLVSIPFLCVLLSLSLSFYPSAIPFIVSLTVLPLLKSPFFSRISPKPIKSFTSSMLTPPFDVQNQQHPVSYPFLKVAMKIDIAKDFEKLNSW